MSEWFSGNKLALNLDKTNVIKFIMNNSQQHTSSIVYKEKCAEELANTKFLGQQLDNRLNCKNHINQLAPKSSGARYVVRSMLHRSNIDTTKSIYFIFFFLLYNEVWNNILE
jgi:hypothetical protein